MRAALHTLMFGGYPLDRVAPVAREIGYTGVALMCRPPHLDLDNPVPSARAGSRILADAGLQVVGLASGLGRPESFTGAPARAELDGVRRALEAANILGAGLLRLWGGADGMSVDNPDELAAAADWYARAATLAAATPVSASPLRSTPRDWPPARLGHLPAGRRHRPPQSRRRPGHRQPARRRQVRRRGRRCPTRCANLRCPRQGHARPAGCRRATPWKWTAATTSTYRWGEGDVGNRETLRQLAAGGYTGWIANESECAWPDWETSVAAARHEYAELDSLIQAAHA